MLTAIEFTASPAMNSERPQPIVNPFEPERYVGTVSLVEAGRVSVNLPHAADFPRAYLGNRVAGGEVGELVVTKSGEYAILGRVSRVRLPERERLAVEPRGGHSALPHPTGDIELLSTIDLAAGRHVPGVARFPRIGDRVFAANPQLIQWVVESQTQLAEVAAEPFVVRLGSLAGSPGLAVRLTPERKSWSLARLVEELSMHPAKVVLIDPTGEFHTLRGQMRHLSIGIRADRPKETVEVAMPHNALAESDLFALFKPSPGIQAPRLRDAIRSLRLAHDLGPAHGLVSSGTILKAEQQREPIDLAMREHAALVHSPSAEFDISLLPEQVRLECVWPTSKFGPTFGGVNQNDLGMCAALITRIENYLVSPEFRPILAPESYASLVEETEDFLASKDLRVLRISLRHLPFSQDAREIVANAIGRYLLTLGREGRFLEHPLLVALDEAHQFLNRSVGDEAMRISLDAFELVAKEGRKYALNLLLATQRPRDLPDGVMSQVGTILVHRLTNERDRHIVERASSDIDRSAQALLPTLVPGEAVLVGVDFPTPLTVSVQPPLHEPDSAGPDYQGAWAATSG